MSDAKLQIDISANTDAAVANIKGLNTALANTEKAAAVGAKGMQTFNKATGTSTQALTNLNRVVQDAPFGLLGVANNIDPLVSSFQKLKVETGSTGKALTSLVGSLAGPTGIAIGISTVVSLIIGAGPKIKEFAGAIFGVKSSADTTSDSVKKLGTSVAQEIVDFSLLVNFAGDATKSYDDRKKAIAALKKEYPGFLQSVGEENILLGKVSEASQKYVESLLKQAVIKTIKDDISALIGEQAKEIIQIKKQQVAQEQEAEARNKRAESVKNFKGNLQDENLALLQSGRATTELSNQYVNLRKSSDNALANRPDEKIKRIVNETNNLVQGLLKSITGFDDIGIKINENTKGTKKLADENDRYIRILEAEDDLLTSITGKGVTRVQRELSPLFQLQDAINKVREAEKKRDDEQKARVLTQATGEGLLPNQKAIDAAIAGFQKAQKAQKDFEKETSLKAITKATQDAQAAFALLSPTIDAAFNSLANGTNIADAVGQAIKQLIINLIKAVAQAALLSLIFSLLPGGSAGQTLLQSKGGFGSVLKNLLGFGARGNAIGGPVSGGQGYIVGENGPELFVPGTPGSIVPNMALAGGGGGNVSFEIRGDVLYGLLRRTANNKMANFG